MLKFTIHLPPISKKNSQQIMVNQRTGKPFIFPSKVYKEYERNALWFIPRQRKPIDFPVNVKCLFYIPTKRKCDLTNLLEAVDDVMVTAGLLADDNFTIIESHDGSRVLYDKKNPRTEVYITAVEKTDHSKDGFTAKTFIDETAAARNAFAEGLAEGLTKPNKQVLKYQEKMMKELLKRRNNVERKNND